MDYVVDRIESLIDCGSEREKWRRSDQGNDHVRVRSRRAFWIVDGRSANQKLHNTKSTRNVDLSFNSQFKDIYSLPRTTTPSTLHVGVSTTSLPHCSTSSTICPERQAF